MGNRFKYKDELIACDCNGTEVEVGDIVKGVKLELPVEITGKLQAIRYENNEPYGKIQGHTGFWNLRLFILVRQEL